MRWLIFGCVALMVSGCAARPEDEGLKSGSGHSSLSLRSGGAIAPQADPSAVKKAPQIVVLLDVYDLSVPAGAISANDEFWKRVDEDQVDIAAHDLLIKNGIRFGLGHDHDWHYFKGLLAKYPEARQTMLRSEPGKEGYMEMPMRTGIPEQNLIGIDDQGVDWGRRFEKCDDLLGITFLASPHNPGVTLVKACPIVRGLRETYSVSVLNNEQTQIEPRHTDHLYNMRLEAMIPLDDFLIIAPSKQANILTTSIGATFLIREGLAEPMEHVLIAVPRTYRSDEPPPSLMDQ